MSGDNLVEKFKGIRALNILVMVKHPSSLDDVKALADPRVREFFYTELDPYLESLAKLAAKELSADVYCECAIDSGLMKFAPTPEVSFATRQAVRRVVSEVVARKEKP